MKLLTGNQIGSLMAYYRAKTLFERGVLNAENAARGVIIKTFVTTDLQKAIAEHYGLRCVETLTGFKYIGAKLGKYESGAAGRGSREISRPLRRRDARRSPRAFLASTSSAARKATATAAHDFVRDKDGNGADDHVLRSGGLCEIARADARCAARRGLRDLRLLSRRKTAR